MADKDTLKDAKEAYSLAVEHEALNRREALDDLRFARLAEQWPEQIRKQREREGRPCLTINRLPAFIRQVLNDARQNQPSIKIHPADSAADPKTAEIYNGLIRNIETTSRADVAYDTALDFAVTMGFGYFRINTQFSHQDSFDLDLVFQRIVNPFSVYADPYSTDSDSSDWKTCFVTDLITRDQFEKQYRDADPVDWDASGYEKLSDPWMQDDRVLIAEYFTREPAEKTILLLSDGSVVDEDVFLANQDTYGPAGITVVSERESSGWKVTQRIMTGAEILKTEDWAGQYIPIVPVYGDEVNVEGRRYFRSLVRDAKDPQRMLNYWRTASTELVALAPKAPFIGPRGAFKTDAAKWVTANTENHPFIEYDGQQMPERQAFAGVPAGALQEALSASDDIKSIIGLYNASLGAQGNEVSGRAIMARQREGDVSTFHFIDNLSRAIEHGGRILIDLIPLVYTGNRIVRVLGPDGLAQNVPLGQPVQIGQGPNGEALSHVFDLSRGKYDLTVETGPSFTTRREETANQIMELIRAYPAAAPVLGDILAKNLDWPGADIIAQRLQALLPAAVQGQQGQGAAAPNGQPQQGAGGAAADPMKQQQLLLQAQEQQQSAGLDERRLQIDAYRAETERMRTVAEIQHRMRDPVIPGAI